MEIPTSPILFSKFSNALTGHKNTVNLPKTAEKFDYEAELAVIIGKTAQYVDEEDALSYVFGYSIGNDLSARDLQMRTGQWLLGKTCDGFAPVGPYIVTTDELSDPNNLDVECKVNGEIRQKANTRDMIFNCAKIISYASQYMTLKPGDIILTGTPDGVILGYPNEKQKWLEPGDEIKVSIGGIGTLSTTLS
jgi:2-keto-4-pentenoate hydratase/2-oxohepta-3-ene-1,7-dioic acid hydratase in catechol pathway